MTTLPPIPQTNPRAAYGAHAAEIEAAIQRVLQSGRYVLGPEVEAFEREFAAFTGTRQAVGVASGTEALWLALRALGTGPGDEVVTVALTASATLAAIVETGARPVFVDVAPDDLTMEPEALGEALTARTKAIVPVHLYGHPARIKDICSIASDYAVPVVEDCGQAHGAEAEGHPAGSWGQLSAFSFYPTKNLGALGDGGAVATTFPRLAERTRLLREYGWRLRGVSSFHGWNSRLDEIQAAVLRVKLQYLPEENERRRQIAAQYDQGLAALFDGRLVRVGQASAGTPVFHQYVVRHAQRDALREALAKQGIGTAVHYPVPVHMQMAYRTHGLGLGSLPETERAAQEVMSLPMYPELTDEEVARVCAALHEAVAVLPPA